MKSSSSFNFIAASAILLQLFVTVQDITIINIALPVLAREFAIDNSMSVWIVTIYQLAITMFLLPLSTLGEKFSYYKIFITGIIIFVCGSAMCAASSHFAMLLCARGLQGIGASCVMSVNTAIVRLVYPPHILGKGLALSAMTVAIATASGPSVAGLILSIFPWQYLFLINIPLGMAAFFLAFRRIPANERQNREFDWIGAGQNALVFGLLFYAAGSFARKGNILLDIGLLCLGFIIAFFYLRRQMSRAVPIFPIDLFKSRTFTLSILTSMSSFIAQNMTMIALPFLFYDAWGFSELMTGALMTPWPLATIVAAPLAARYVNKYNPEYLASGGMILYALGVLLLLLIPSGNTDMLDICWRMVVCGLGFGIFQTPNNYVMITSTPMERSGAAAGMQACARLIGQTVGAVLVSILFSRIASTGAASHLCLYAAIGFSVFAACFSINRKPGKK